MSAAFLLGCLVGACGVFVLTGLALYFVEMRNAWREGTALNQEISRRLRGVHDDADR